MDETKNRLLRKGDYIYGSFLKPEEVAGYINGVNPGDRNDVLGRFPFSLADVDEAIEYANIGCRTWRRLPLTERATAIRRFRDQLARSQERVARLVTRETGKPIWESRQEVLASVRAVDLFLEEGVNMLAPRVIEEIGARSDRMPRGVVAIFSPYNFPVLIPVTHAVSALIGGNSVVVKPSKFTPGVGQTLAELWDRCRLPRGAYNMIQGPGTVIGMRIVQHPSLNAVVFSGSYATATAIRQATADRTELPLIFQCGGKGIAIVLDDAEIDRAVYEVMVGAYLSSGQRHNSTGRVIVTEGIYDAFVDSLMRHTAALEVGYGFDPDVFMGPVISENLRSRYRRYARRLVSKGHQPIIEAATERADHRGFYARPAIYRVHWDKGEPFIGEEPPGPMLLVYKVATWKEAAALHNENAFRLSTSVFTRVEGPILAELRDRLRTGALNINRGTIGASLRLPAVGLGRSSNGVAGGLDLVHALTQPRSQLVDMRPFNGAQVLPGTNWNSPTPVQPAMEDEDDLSAALMELTAE